ncbi:ABC transporter permease [Actinomyces sp.]|uniref:ABC transporter permease n=1 Tax=Actinomyces sp. TaxID=29317 RepID=UPI0026DB801F|nr:ABC-2 family transporter protein [Actinomyces sp.]MDO4899759.1 ABC-2 family transporter protein [Actinomyces sp.]
MHGLVYFAYLRAHVISVLRFRLDFVIGLASSLLETALSAVFLMVVFSQVNALAGVPFSDVLLMFAFSTLGRAGHLLFFDNLWVLGSRFIQQGEFDRVLVRPRGLLFQVVAERVNIQGIGQVIVGVLALGWALMCHTPFVGIASLLAIPLLIAASAAVFILVHVCLASLSFWLVDSSGVMSAVFSVASFGQYPLGIFPTAVSGVLLTVLPFAFTGYVPAGLLTGDLGFGWAMALMGVLVALVYAAAALWRRGVAEYTSTGS